MTNNDHLASDQRAAAIREAEYAFRFIEEYRRFAPEDKGRPVQRDHGGLARRNGPGAAHSKDAQGRTGHHSHRSF